MSTFQHRPWSTSLMLLLFLLVAACTPQSTSQLGQPATSEITPSPLQLPTEAEMLTKEEELEDLLREVLIGDLKDVIFDHNGEPGMLFISWDLQSAYSNELIADGAKEDTVEILRTIVESDVEYEEVNISAWYPMTVDINNNVEDTEVISLYYDRATLEGRNWDTIRKQYIWWIADRGFVNKELQR